MNKKNVISTKSFDFAVRIVNLYRHLTNEKKEFILSKQLLRCGTSIGANVSEAQKGQSTADFNSKMYVSLKEANETEYWLRLLFKTEYLTQAEFDSLEKDITEIIAILMSITKSMKMKDKKQ
ncbi:MAG: four helix bundle protein [Clostridia bacterium]|nr:four helix bundle protein [Clostridia bacterium]